MRDLIEGKNLSKLVLSTSDPEVAKIIENCFDSYQYEISCVTTLAKLTMLARDEDAKSGSTVVIIDVSSAADAIREILLATARFHSSVIILLSRCELAELSPHLNSVTAIIPVEDALECLHRAVLLGMSGFTVFKNLSVEASVPTIDAGEYDGDIARLEALTSTEARVLLCLAEGASNKVIGRELGISDNTVRVHMRTIFIKTGLENRTQAALLAIRYQYTGILQGKAGAVQKTVNG